MFKSSVVIAFIVALTGFSQGLLADISVPAFTAYILPNPAGARVTERSGVTRWSDTQQSVNWYGKFARAGKVNVSVVVAGTQGQQSQFRMTVDGEAREVSVAGDSAKTQIADFGTFEISGAGHKRFQLERLNSDGQAPGEIKSLELSGPATEGIHFNLKERRNAASVHLAYPVPKQTEVEAFYCEVTAVEEPITTFYMACGWHRGYFGMQVNSPTERRIIFSVWDSGNEAVDRNKVASENRVTLMGKGAGVYSGDFGNEGTGGHSHLKVMWKTGQVQKFLVTAEPVDKTFTIFSGYWFHPDQNKWMLISSWKAPREGGYLRGLHSFSENFAGESGHLLRKARFGNQWIRTTEQKWVELPTATFSHDPTGKDDRFDRYMGVEDGQFFLSHGGFLDGYSKFGEKFDRPASGIAPIVSELPPISIP